MANVKNTDGKWIYFELRDDMNDEDGYGYLLCPGCLHAMPYILINEELQGMKHCPWCGSLRDGYVMADEEN